MSHNTSLFGENPTNTFQDIVLTSPESAVFQYTLFHRDLDLWPLKGKTAKPALLGRLGGVNLKKWTLGSSWPSLQCLFVGWQEGYPVCKNPAPEIPK